MPGPRIYTEAWQRLKIAAKETEAREPEEPPHVADSPEKPRRLRGPRPFIVAIAVSVFLSILTASLWIDSQARLMTAARDVADFRTRLELLQENMKKVEDERQRLEEENGTLSMQYEQRAAELGQLEQELDALRGQKERSNTNLHSKVDRGGSDLVKAAGVPKKAIQEPAPSTLREEQGGASKPQRSEQQDVEVHTIN